MFGNVLVLNISLEGNTTLRGIDERTGSVLWTRHGFITNLVNGGGYLYFSEYDDGGFLPGSVLTRLDTRTGRARSAALLRDADLSAIDPADDLLDFSFEAGSHHWYVAGLRTAETYYPWVLGGAPAHDWPQACNLLTARDLAASIPSTTYRPKIAPETDLDAQTDPNGACRFLPRSSERPGDYGVDRVVRDPATPRPSVR